MLPLPLSKSEGLLLHLIILSKRAVISVSLVEIALWLVGFVIFLILRLRGVGGGGLFIGFFRVSSVVVILGVKCIF